MSMRKKPWNLINAPVYSLATENHGAVNMNICTYVTAISMKPKQYVVGVYDGTRTLQNILQTERAVLQLLSKTQINVVRNLGNKSGLKFNKDAWLRKKNLLANWNGFEVLKDAAACLLIQKISEQQAGDHLMCLFEVMDYCSYGSDILTLDDLREKKMIRI
jgi:flavin reductase (DIM6/NTAB) family NADH-FMN oxidoreductase RutF